MEMLHGSVDKGSIVVTLDRGHPVGMDLASSRRHASLAALALLACLFWLL